MSILERHKLSVEQEKQRYVCGKRDMGGASLQALTHKLRVRRVNLPLNHLLVGSYRGANVCGSGAAGKKNNRCWTSGSRRQKAKQECPGLSGRRERGKR